MPIQDWPLSTKQTLAFQSALDQLAQIEKVPTGLKISSVLPIYNVGVREILMNGSLADSGTQVGWRYFASGGSNERTTAVSGDISLSSIPRVASLAVGSPVLETLRTIDTLRTLPDFQTVPLEPRLLRIPGLLLECLWFSPIQQPGGGTGGWVAPYRSLIPDLDPRETVDSFYKKILPWAQRALAKGSRPAA